MRRMGFWVQVRFANSKYLLNFEMKTTVLKLFVMDSLFTGFCPVQLPKPPFLKPPSKKTTSHSHSSRVSGVRIG
jgi:hypothetical protein